MILYNLRGCGVGIVIRSKLRLRLLLPLVAIAMLACLGFFLTAYPVKADSAITDWSWAGSTPTVADSSPVTDVASQYCSGTYQSEDVVGEGTKWVCVVQGQHIKVGTYFTGYVFRTVVGFSYETKMYPVFGTGSCEQSGGCMYVPGSDTFVTKQNLINNLVQSLVIYKNFTKRLTKMLDAYSLTKGYNFDLSNPDYTFKSASGYAWPVGGVGASNNGEWLAVEFRERGIGILNMTTFEMKRISTLALSYGRGRDPATELTITNNGNHIAMMGTNYGGITVFDNAPDCGDKASDDAMQYILPIEHHCRESGIYTGGFINRFFSAINPRFNDDGAELDFFAKSYSDGPRVVSLHANGYESQRLDYLALGDSFTSGEGEIDDKYYQPGTNDEFEKCHLSTRSYPYLIAATLGIDPQYVRSVACSGAKTTDVVGADDTYWGQGNRLKKGGLGLSDSDKTLYQESASNTFNPGRIHQLDFVRRYKPKVITIGIGGNDVGFMDKLRSCVGLDTCEWADTPEGREKTALEVESAFDTLTNTYLAIQSASPASKIYVIGYPKIIDDGGQCGPLDGTLLNTTERNFMNEGISYINQVISAAAQKAGVKYIDIQNSLGNQVLCGSSQPSVMNGVTLGDDAAISSRLSWLKLIGNESFHPRPAAHIDIASAAIQSVPNLQTYDYCETEFSEQNGTCQIYNATAPYPSDYWLNDGITHGYDSQHIADFVSDNTGMTNPQQKTINIDEFSLAPNTPVTVEIHSDPILLATSTVGQFGGVSLNIELPANLPEGFHTIHLYGTSYSGERVDLYQVIKYTLPGETSSDSSSLTIPAVVKETSDDKQSDSNGTVDSSLGSQKKSDDVATLAYEEKLITPDGTNPVSSLLTVPNKANNLGDVFSFLIPVLTGLLFCTGFVIYARFKRKRR